jgi:hypothetical protein
MLLKGGHPSFEGEEQADRWTLDSRLSEVADRWRIAPARDLVQTAGAAS